MVECGGLENRYSGNAIQGSNPCFSASKSLYNKSNIYYRLYFLNKPSLSIYVNLAIDFLLLTL